MARYSVGMTNAAPSNIIEFPSQQPTKTGKRTPAGIRCASCFTGRDVTLSYITDRDDPQKCGRCRQWTHLTPALRDALENEARGVRPAVGPTMMERLQAMQRGEVLPPLTSATIEALKNGR